MPLFKTIINVLVILFISWTAAMSSTEQVDQWRFKGSVLALSDAVPDIRLKALKALNRQNALNKLSLDHLLLTIPLIESKDATTRKLTIQYLGNISKHPPEVISVIKDTLNDIAPDVRKASIQFLMTSKQIKNSSSKIIDMLDDQNSEVRTTALQATAQFLSPNKLSDIVNSLINKDNPDCNILKDAFGYEPNLSNNAVETVFASLLTHSNECVKKTALEILILYPEATIQNIDHILPLLKQDDPTIKIIILKAIHDIDFYTKSIIDAVAPLIKDNNTIVQAQAIRTLSKSEKWANRYLSNFILFIQYGSSQTRFAAVDAIGNIKHISQPDQKKLISLLKNEDADICEAVIKAIGKNKVLRSKYIDLILTYASHESFFVRQAVVNVIAQVDTMTSDQQTIILNTFIKDSNPTIRLNASNMLFSLDKSIISNNQQVLVQLLKDSDKRIRVETLKFLEKSGFEIKAYYPRIKKFILDRDLDIQYHTLLLMRKDKKFVVSNIKLFIEGLNSKKSEIRRLCGDILIHTKEIHSKDINQINAVASNQNKDIRINAIRTLILMDKMSASTLLSIMDLLYRTPNDQKEIQHEIRFHAYLSGYRHNVDTLLKWVASPQENYPQKPDKKEAVKALSVFDSVWNASSKYPDLNKDLANQTAIIISQKGIIWNENDLKLLQKHFNNLSGYPEQDAVRNMIKQIKSRSNQKKYIFVLGFIVSLLIIHFILTLLFLQSYSCFSFIRNIILNRRNFRRYAGLFYIDRIINTPWFRKKIFVADPFKDKLIPDHVITRLHKETYYPYMEVSHEDSKAPMSLLSEINKIKGKIVLEGEPGTGKSMFASYLITQKIKTPIAYLYARDCGQGIIQAIINKISDKDIDIKLLSKLIKSGALDICIDDIDQTSPEIRSTITQTAENLSCNILFLTQPAHWVQPDHWTKYQLSPLPEENIDDFLRFFSHTIEDLKDREKYIKLYKNFLGKVLNDKKDKYLYNQRLYILSKPHKLFEVSEILKLKKEPDLFVLTDQYMDIILGSFLNQYKKQFPLYKVSEYFYMCIKEVIPITDTSFQDFFSDLTVLNHLKTNKILIPDLIQNTTHYCFSNNIYRYLFLYPFFSKNIELWKKHLDDQNMNGVYPLLASRLSFKDAKKLRETLIEHAAESKNNYISNLYVLKFKNIRLIKQKHKINHPLNPYLKEKQHIFITDPYMPGGISPHMVEKLFVGRDDLFQWVENHLENSNLLMINGHKRIGKSWALYRLMKKLNQDYICAYIDVQGLSGLKGMSNIFQQIAFQIIRSIGHPEIQLPSNELLSNNQFVQFLDTICTIDHQKKLLLMFDEFQGFDVFIEDHNLSKMFYDFLRYLISNTGNNIRFMITGVLTSMNQRLLSNLSGISPEMFNLDILQTADAEKLIEEPLNNQGIAIDYLYVEQIIKMSGMQPFYIQLLCSKIIDELNASRQLYVSKIVMDAVYNKLVAHPPTNLHFFWRQQLDADEQKLCIALEKHLRMGHKEYVSVEDIIDQQGLFDQPIPTILKQLVNNNIIDITNESHYIFKFGMLQSFIRYSLP